MPSELKPCPWCNGPAETRNSRWYGTDHWGVACTGCGNPWFDYRAITEAEAIAAWNQRPEPATPAGDDADLLDEIAEAISDTLDMDWQPSWAAPNILALINREKAAAHAAGRAAERAEETGWLIEHADEPKWLTLRPGEACFEVCWTKVSLEALRFARRTDAEDYVSTYFGGDGPIRITEHMWTDAIERGQHGSKGDE